MAKQDSQKRLMFKGKRLERTIIKKALPFWFWLSCLAILVFGYLV
jgi:hypothetical protein